MITSLPQDRELPGYSLPMEIACTVPPTLTATLKELAEDFGLRGPAKVHVEIQKLQVRGFGLVVANGPRGRIVQWESVFMAASGEGHCLAYRKAVYPWEKRL